MGSVYVGCSSFYSFSSWVIPTQRVCVCGCVCVLAFHSLLLGHFRLCFLPHSTRINRSFVVSVSMGKAITITTDDSQTYCLDKVGATPSTTTKCCFYTHICHEYAKDLMPDDPFHAQLASWNDRRSIKAFI